MRSLSNLIFCFLLVVFYLRNIEACGAKKGAKAADPNKGQSQPANNNNAAPSQNPPGDTLQNLLGPNVKTSPMDNSGYDSKNGQASSPDDLKCDFEGNCCWKNTKPPYDDMEFLKANGSPDPQKLQSNFGTSTAPSGNYLLTGADKNAKPEDKAEWESCSIPCAGDNIKVTFKHWATQGVKYKVCEVAKANPGMLLNCQDVPGSSPGPDTVSLPPGSDIIISIVATGFGAPGGSAAMIDDISVDYPPCTTTTTTPAAAAATTTTPGAVPETQPPTQPPPPADDISGLCSKFSSGAGKWSKGGGPSNGKSCNGFENSKDKYYKNHATGVPTSRDNSYMAAYHKPKECSYMETPCSLSQDTTIRFEEYKATQDITLKVCCQTEAGCSYDTGGKTEKGDFRQWFSGSVKCPAGTTKVIVYAENNGVNEGGVGIDNFDVVDESGNSKCQGQADRKHKKHIRK